MRSAYVLGQQQPVMLANAILKTFDASCCLVESSVELLYDKLIGVIAFFEDCVFTFEVLPFLLQRL
jgi:hypothetical protein